MKIINLKFFTLIFIAFSVSFLTILKLLIFNDCFSFDTHDDANHAFPNLAVAREAILAGQIPTINFYNNFGAPLLGDALTYPFAIQSLTYYFFEDHIAMSINRFFISFVTIIFGYLFSRIYLAYFPALICSLLIAFNPVAFWYPVHQYQLATPFFLISFYLLNKFYIFKNLKYYILLCASFVFMILSVSINHVLLFFPFLFTWAFFRNNFKLNKFFFVPIITYLSGFIFSYSQTLDFFENFFQSARIGESVYSNILTNLRELYFGVIIPPGEWIPYNYGAQLQVTTYIAVPILISIFIGIFIVKNKLPWKSLTLFFTGIVPTLIALFLYINPDIRLNLPFIKNIDITRVFWFSIPFSYIYVGYFLSIIWFNKLKFIHALVCVIFLISNLFILKIFPELRDVSNFHFFIILIFLVGILGVFFNNFVKINNIKFISYSCIIASILLTTLPISVRILGLNSGYCGGTQYSANLALSRFIPNELISLVKKNNRLATEMHTYLGHDLRLAHHKILGSNARAIVVNKKFGSYLENKNLVTIDQIPYGYFFSRPWDTEELTLLGIRYLLVNQNQGQFLQSKGWLFLGKSSGLSLYENPNKPTPIYFLNSKKITPINEFEIKSNKIYVDIKNYKEDTKLIFSFLNRSGFKLFIDGKKRKINEEKNGFVSVDVKSSDKKVLLWHKKFVYLDILSGVLLSILINLFYIRFVFFRDRV